MSLKLFHKQHLNWLHNLIWCLFEHLFVHLVKVVFFFNFFFLKNKFIYLCVFGCVHWVFVSVWGLSSSCGERGPLFIAVCGPLTIVASPVVEHRVQTRRLSSCGSQAHLLRGMWDLPRPGLEPVSPALAGRFSTTVPPGKPSFLTFNFEIISDLQISCKNITSTPIYPSASLWWFLSDFCLVKLLFSSL